jgi:hypothetical protein
MDTPPTSKKGRQAMQAIIPKTIPCFHAKRCPFPLEKNRGDLHVVMKISRTPFSALKRPQTAPNDQKSARFPIKIPVFREETQSGESK